MEPRGICTFCAFCRFAQQIGWSRRSTKSDVVGRITPRLSREDNSQSQRRSAQYARHAAKRNDFWSFSTGIVLLSYKIGDALSSASNLGITSLPIAYEICLTDGVPLSFQPPRGPKSGNDDHFAQNRISTTGAHETACDAPAVGAGLERPSAVTPSMFTA